VKESTVVLLRAIPAAVFLALVPDFTLAGNINMTYKTEEIESLLLFLHRAITAAVLTEPVPGLYWHRTSA